jgi:hypothetical protein
VTLAAVDVDVLLKVVGVSLGAGLLLAVAYCLCLYGGIGYVDRRRAGQTAAAIPFGILAVVGGAVFVAALILGLAIMTSKG